MTISNLQAEEVSVDFLCLDTSSVFSWTISNEAGHTAFSSDYYVGVDTCFMSLPQDAYYSLNIYIDSIVDTSAFLLELQVNGAAVLLINSDVGLGEFSYSFYTGVKVPELRIVGGTDASIADFPWQVYLRAGNYECGGTIISKRWILTAAHCTQGDDAQIPSSEMYVIVGTSRPYSSGKKYLVKSCEVHSAYNNESLHNDIAVLELYDDIDFANAEVISLVSENEVNDGATDPGVMSTVTGWGKSSIDPEIYPSVLQKVQLPLISNATASTVWGNHPSSMLFAGYKNGSKDACNGDSGGPLVVSVDGEMKISGIVSWGSVDCNTYGAFTRVSSFLDWIEDKTGVLPGNTLARPDGEFEICEGTELSQYTTSASPGLLYEWQLLPSEAGDLTFEEHVATVSWAEEFLGSAEIKVRANITGEFSPWSTRELEVQERTHLFSFSSDTTLCQGEAVVLSVEAEGQDLSYTWFKNGEEYLSPSSKDVDFEQLDTLDAGIYTCMVFGACGDTTTAEMYLDVLPRTYIKDISTDVNSVQGEDVSLFVSSIGVDRVYQWYKERVAIDGATANVLLLDEADASDIARYHVKIDGACSRAVSDYIYVYVDAKASDKVRARVWPSVSDQEFYIATSNTESYSVFVYDVNGVLIYSDAALAHQTRIDISLWQNGVFFVKVTADGLNEVFSIMKR